MVGHHRDISITLESISLALNDGSGKSFRRIRFHPVGRERGGEREKTRRIHAWKGRKEGRGGKKRDDRHREGVSRSTNLSRIEWDRWGRY